jgi:LCP family protein required for cell wall assembly
MSFPHAPFSRRGSGPFAPAAPRHRSCSGAAGSSGASGGGQRMVSEWNTAPKPSFWPRLRRLGWLLLLLVVFLAGFISCAAARFYIDRAFPQVPPGVALWVVYLLDASNQRADGIRIFSAGKTVVEMAVPRDTLIRLPGRPPTRISSLYHELGPEGLTRLLADRFGIPLRRFVVVRQDALAHLVDQVEGVPFNLKAPVRFQDWTTHRQVSIPAGKRVLSGEQFVNAGRQRGSAGDSGDRLPRQRELIEALAFRIARQVRDKPAVIIPRLLAAPDTFPNNLSASERSLAALCGIQGAMNRRIETIDPPGHNAANRFELDAAGARQAGWKLLDLAAGRPVRRGIVIEASTDALAASARKKVERVGFHVIDIRITPEKNCSFIAVPHSEDWVERAQPLQKIFHLDRIHQHPRLNYAVLSIAS